MAAQSIERRGALAGEQLARPMAHQRGLVVDRTHRHEPLARTTHRLVDRRCVNLVAFVAAHVGLHMRGRNEPHFMSKFDQRPPPMMRRGARLHRHHARRQLGEERDQLAAREFARHNDLALRVDCVNLKHPLRQIETNPRDSRHIPDRLAHGRLPFRWGLDNDHLGTLMPFGAPSTPSFANGLASGLNYPKPSFGHRLEDRRSPTQLDFQEINAAPTGFVLRIRPCGTCGGKPGRRTMRLTTLLFASFVAAFSVPALAQALLKLGLLLDMAGPYADVGGQGTVTATSMAVDDFGGTVLGRPIEVVFADHQNKADLAASLARQWFDEQGVETILDVAGSSA